jgi:oligopeptidase B
MVARVKADDSTVPVYDRGWWIWRQFEAGVDTPQADAPPRRPRGPGPAARAEVLLDLPQQAIAQRFYSLGMATVSPDGQWLAWTEDVIGRGSHDLYIQNLRTRRLQPERIRGVLEGFAWAADSRTLFYVRQDPVTLHSGAVWRHRTRHRRQPRRAGARRGRQDAVRRGAGQRVAPLRADRHPRHRHRRAAHGAGRRRRPGRRRWSLRGATACVCMPTTWPTAGCCAPTKASPTSAWWKRPRRTPTGATPGATLVPARADATLEGFGLFEDAIAVEERVQARRRVRVLGLNGKDLRIVDGGEAASVSLGDNRDPAAAFVQVVVQSMVRPPATLDVHLASGREVLRRQDGAGPGPGAVPQPAGLGPGARRREGAGHAGLARRPRATRRHARRCCWKPTAPTATRTNPSSSPTGCRCWTAASWSASRMCAAAPNWARPGTRLGG